MMDSTVLDETIRAKYIYPWLSQDVGTKATIVYARRNGGWGNVSE